MDNVKDLCEIIMKMRQRESNKKRKKWLQNTEIEPVKLLQLII